MPSLSCNKILAELPLSAQLEMQGFGFLLELDRDVFPDIYLAAQPCIGFPLSGLFSVMLESDFGESVEVAQVGIESGIWFQGEAASIPNAFYRWSAATESILLIVETEFLNERRFPFRGFQKRLRKKNRRELLQAPQIALCLRHHSILQQLCRWLTIASFRTGNTVLPFTQQTIADKLGVRRESITNNVSSLEKKGLLKTYRGGICLLDRERIAAESCQCVGRLREIADA